MVSVTRHLIVQRAPHMPLHAHPMDKMYAPKPRLVYGTPYTVAHGVDQLRSCVLLRLTATTAIVISATLRMKTLATSNDWT